MSADLTLIPLTVEARGEIITNNLPEFREMIREALGNINRDLKTDDDFEQAEKDVKALKAAEEAVRSAAIKAFDDQLKALVDGLNETAEDIRAPRLEIEKLIAKRKDEVKADLIKQALDCLECAPRLRQPAYGKNLAEVIKGKRTLDSMAKALEVAVATHNTSITKNRAAIESFRNAHGEELVPDADDLEVKSPDAVDGELRRRFEAKKAMEERKRLEAEAAEAKAAAQAAIREAEAAKKPAPPLKGMLPKSDLPQPPKIGSIPTGPSPIAEWTAWLNACKSTFATLKVARESLKHADNIRRASILANGINSAWKAMQEAVGEEQG